MFTGYFTIAMFALLAVDLAISTLVGRKSYRFDETATSIASFVSAKLFLLLVSAWLPVARASEGPAHAARWIACFLACDFLYYVSHRAYHEVPALWPFHAVHHQSDEFNLAAGLRTGWFTNLIGAAFYLPLLLFGFDGKMILVCTSLVGIFQFLIHQEGIPKLGWIERVLVTPSQHRVHHGRDAAYVNRNYGGVLVLWDRVFGSFREETHKPSYGVAEMPPRRDFVTLNLHPFGGWIARLAPAATSPVPGSRARAFAVFAIATATLYLMACLGGALTVPLATQLVAFALFQLALFRAAVLLDA